MVLGGFIQESDSSLISLVLSLAIHGILIFLLLNTDSISLVSERDEPLEIVFQREAPVTKKFSATPPQAKDDVDTSENKEAKFSADRTLFAPKDQFALSRRSKIEADLKSGGNGRSKNDHKNKADADESNDFQANNERKPLELPGFGRSTGDGNLNVPFEVQQRMPPGVELGNITSLNTSHSRYISFISRIKNNVVPSWATRVFNAVHKEMKMDSLPGVGKNFVTEIEVTMDENGNILDIKPFRLSGKWSFDSALIDAFTQAKSIPNPPEGMIDENGYVRMQFRATVHWIPPTRKPIHSQFAN